MTSKMSYSDRSHYMSDDREDNFNLEKYNKKVTGASYNYFCVFRIEKKYKTLDSLKQFEVHNLRKREVQNADPERSKFNRVLIGSENIIEDIKRHTYGIKLRSNAVLATDMVLTVNHKFFENLPPQELEKWISWNIEFLKENFGENCLSAVLHMDETAPHLHCLISPRFWDEEKHRYELSNSRYFGSKQQLRDWQTKYADHMHQKFNTLIRGIKGSKAHHIDIKTYYSILNKKLNEKDNNSVLAYAKYGYLAEKRVRMLENTVMQLQEDNDGKQLLKRVENAEKKTKEYKEVTKAIIKKYGLKEKDVIEIIDKIQERNNSKERER